MSKAFISILGTNDYIESFHQIGGKIISTIPVKYVQEDLVNYLSDKWEHDFDVRIFLTDEAKFKNWEDNGHKDFKTGEPIPNKGLKNRLLELKGKNNFNIYDYSIPTGNNENEIWDIFEIIFSTFNENEKVIIDITHSFRFLPLLLTVMLNYTRQVKKINIVAVYYAAFESLGTIQEVKTMPVKKRIVPIFDLTPLIKLQEWTLATYDFTTNANTSLLKNLVQNEIKTIIYNKKNLRIGEKLLSKTMKSLDVISKNIALCRGTEIINYDYEKLRNDLNELKQYNLILKPAKQLLDVIKEKLQDFKNNEISNGIKAVEWAIGHGLYQQAITLLQETLITKILVIAKLDFSKKIHREIVTSAIKIKSKNINEKKWNDIAKNNFRVTKKILSLNLLDEIMRDYEKLTSIRNDVNHAGFLTDPRPQNHDKIINKLSKIYNSIKKYLV